MNNQFFIPPPQAQQTEEAEQTLGACEPSVTRRRFLRATGGASVAALVAWNAGIKTVKASEEGGSWKMKCVDPSYDENPVEYEIPLVIIQPTPNPAITTTIKIVAGSGVEASDTLYSSLSFIGTGSVRIANGSPSSFSNSYNVECNPATGEISSSGTSTSATSRTVRIGQVDVTYAALPEDIYPPGQEGGPAMRTAVRAYVEYTVNNSTVNTFVPATNGDPVYVWSIFIPVQSQ